MNNKITNAKHRVPKHTHQQSTMKSAVSDGSVPATQRLAPSKLYSSASTVLLISSSPPQLPSHNSNNLPTHTHTPNPLQSCIHTNGKYLPNVIFPPIPFRKPSAEAYPSSMLGRFDNGFSQPTRTGWRNFHHTPACRESGRKGSRRLNGIGLIPWKAEKWTAR